MKKNLMGILLISLLSLSLVACGEKKEQEPQPVNPPKTEDVADKDNSSNDTNKDDKTESKSVRLYFFDMEQMKDVYIDKDITITDKALVSALTKAHQEDKTSDNFVTLTNKVGVSKANLEDGILKIYFNDDFTKYMNLGSSSESGLVSGLINTYGYNYGVDKVAIYCKDELYTGLRGELPEGYYEVNYKNASPYNK